MADYDAIVLGVGGVGSAALYHFAQRGARVLGLERHEVPHTLGSSHGHTRIIRQAYFEHPDYVPLLREAYQLWEELQIEAGRPLMQLCGLVEIGPPDGVVVPGVIRAAADHGLSIEELAPQEIEDRWPVLRVPRSMTGVFEKAAGYLLVEECVRAHCEQAVRRGAELVTGCEVSGWRQDGGRVVVESTRGADRAERLVVCAGPWAASLLANRGLPLRVLRKSMFWYEDEHEVHGAANCPAFLFELPASVMYGIPSSDQRGLKLANHAGGMAVNDPSSIDRSCRAEERSEIEAFATAHLPHWSRHLVDHAACLYTLSPDEHFIVDFDPHTSGVVFCGGLSGHGFKFTAALGKILVDLALTGSSELPVGMFRLSRFTNQVT